ncbi:MAG: fatty acid cis/trans isomerase [Pseudomonas sp.]|uniref:fatty acid cis/trans isomerase n=1 Tax=Pseudomonas sp. TaxID=306 RepID=UPI00339475F1
MPNRIVCALLLLLPGQGLWAAPLSYSRDVQPILTEKCLACHACYDAPCQLNLGSGEGAQRGANPTPVYDGGRTEPESTSRLFLDAQGPAAWRRKGFFSVLDARNGQAALMARMLELGRQQPLPAHAKVPAAIELGIARANQCPRPEQFDAYAATRPGEGMPLAVAGLSDPQYRTLQAWLAAGAPVDEQAPQPSPAARRQVADWERLLNAPGAREALVNRWLYEHLFLAHLYFQDDAAGAGGAPGQFFQLVRSRTPSGQPIEPIASRRPNDDPGPQFYYRLWPVQGVIVHKTHITYPLSAAKLARVRSLFFSGDWQAPQVPGYGVHQRANPFETFAAIPPEARYQFMLDNAEYFVRTFIRGPVCRGQIATDVIHDHFWTFFQAPQQDRYVTDARYRREVTPLLAMPGQLDQLTSLPALWRAYRDKRNAYETLRSATYAQGPRPDWSHIWAGNDNALLSIFRHFDSAEVRKGLIGEVPQTLWWFDYPLFERTYYQLVVNFDVYGNVSHQAQTRLYFDLIRNGAEQNFLRLMPAGSRREILADWYQRAGQLKIWIGYEDIDSETPSGLALPEDKPKPAFARELLQRFGNLDAARDPLNRCISAHCYRPGMAPVVQQAEQALSRLAGQPAGALKVIEHLPEASLLRLELADGSREVYSLLRNRAHSNVAFMMGEALRYQPTLDSLTVYPGVMTSYPNFIFNLKAEEAPAFVAALEQARDPGAFDRLVRRWGVRRSHPQFWFYFHDLSSYLRETEPVEAGVLDMNRYQNL